MNVHTRVVDDDSVRASRHETRKLELCSRRGPATDSDGHRPRPVGATSDVRSSQ